MSYVPKAERRGCLPLDLNQSLEEMDPQLNLEHNPTDTMKLKPSKASEALHGGHVLHHEELEYSCNFCPKKFSNKQALGGHQNAHKIEKVIQRRAWQGHEAHFGYTGNSSSNGLTSFAFPNSVNQAPKMMSPHYPQSMQHQMYARDYPGFISPKSHESGVIPMSHESGVIPMSHESGVMKLGSFYKSPTSPQFMSFQKMMEQGASTSKGKSSAIAKNDHADYYGQINNAESKQHEDDLDLSLKL